MKKGWRKTALGTAFTTVTGNTPPKNNAAFFGDFMPLVKPPELLDSRVDSAEDGLSEAGVKVARVAPPNSILVSCIGNLGKIGLNTVSVAFNQQITAISPDETRAVPKFMFYQVLSSNFKDQLEVLSSGTTVPIVNKSKFNSIEIVLAPLSEQRRIVGILDEAFAGIATAKANAEKNLQNARALFESHLNAVFTRRGNDEVEKPLKEYVDDISTGPFGSLLHKSDYEVGGIPLVNPINIVDNRVVPDERKAVGKATTERLSRYVLQKDDIVIGRRGEIGRCAVISEDQAGWLCGTGSFFIRPSNQTDPHFLAHLLRSQHYRKQLEQLSERATMPSISNSDLANLVIAVPSVKRQKRILSLLDALASETQRLTRIYEQKLAALAALKKSFLHQAFRGEV